MAEAPVGRWQPVRFFQNFGLLIIFMVVVAALMALSPGAFARPANLVGIIKQASINGVLAMGMMFVIISGGIDLSVGAMVALIAGSVIIMMNHMPLQGSPVLVVLAGMAVSVLLGALFGLGHGLLITKGRIEPFIVTLGTMGIFRAFLTFFADGGAITLNDDLAKVYSPVYYGVLFRVPIPVWVLLIATGAGAVLLNYTRFGRYVQAIGSNETVSRYAAVDVDRVKILTYVLLGVCVGITTVLYIPQLASASSSTGQLWELEAIAAVIVGGTAFKGGEGSITGTVVGALLLSTIGNLLNVTSIISVYLNSAMQGFVIIIVAFLQRRRK